MSGGNAGTLPSVAAGLCVFALNKQGFWECGHTLHVQVHQNCTSSAQVHPRRCHSRQMASPLAPARPPCLLSPAPMHAGLIAVSLARSCSTSCCMCSQRQPTEIYHVTLLQGSGNEVQGSAACAQKPRSLLGVRRGHVHAASWHEPSTDRLDGAACRKVLYNIRKPRQCCDPHAAVRAQEPCWKCTFVTLTRGQKQLAADSTEQGRWHTKAYQHATHKGNPAD